MGQIGWRVCAAAVAVSATTGAFAVAAHLDSTSQPPLLPVNSRNTFTIAVLDPGVEVDVAMEAISFDWDGHFVDLTISTPHANGGAVVEIAGDIAPLDTAQGLDRSSRRMGYLPEGMRSRRFTAWFTDPLSSMQAGTLVVQAPTLAQLVFRAPDFDSTFTDRGVGRSPDGRRWSSVSHGTLSFRLPERGPVTFAAPALDPVASGNGAVSRGCPLVTVSDR